jgi:hypothetical protein
MVSRLVGYPATVIACASAPSNMSGALVWMAIGVTGLLLRARTAWVEWRALAPLATGEPSDGPAAAPYRTAERREGEDDGRAAARALLRRAVAWELAIRLAIPLATALLCTALAFLR